MCCGSRPASRSMSVRRTSRAPIWVPPVTAPRVPGVYLAGRHLLFELALPGSPRTTGPRPGNVGRGQLTKQEAPRLGDSVCGQRRLGGRLCVPVNGTRPGVLGLPLEGIVDGPGTRIRLRYCAWNLKVPSPHAYAVGLDESFAPHTKSNRPPRNFKVPHSRGDEVQVVVGVRGPPVEALGLLAAFMSGK